MHRKVDQRPSLARQPWSGVPPLATVARLLSSQGNSPMAPAPAAPLGLCFPQAPQPSAAVVPAFETITEALIASQQGRWHPASRAIEVASLTGRRAAMPRDHAARPKGERCEPYSSR